MLEQHRSGRLVAWGNAWLSGQTSLDDAAAHTVGGDDPHRVSGLPAEPTPVGLTLALGRLRALGTVRLRLALPAPGDPLGLPGPSEFNEAATEAGEAVLAVGGRPLGLIPEVTEYGPVGDRGASVVWHTHRVTDRPVPDLPSLAEAERELTEAVHEATATLGRLDVARWRPEVAETLQAIRDHGRSDGTGLAPGYPARAHRVLVLAQRLAAITALARTDDGGALTVAEATAREAALRPLERSSRRAQLAAYNAGAESPPSS